MNTIDLTNMFHHTSPTWDGSTKYDLKLISGYENVFYKHIFTMHANLGTHLDAPAHVVPGGKKITEISLSELIAPAHIIYIDAAYSPEYRVHVSDIIAYEEKYGMIMPGSWVLFMTGWGAWWDIPERYKNIDATSTPRFPQISAEVAQLLVQRKITGIAVDTFSPDNADTDWQTHKILLGAGILIVENLKFIEHLPCNGTIFGCFPLLIEDAVESPIRAVLFVK